FNRGMLFNIGYKEALSLSDGNQAPLCLILHDVDLLLENDRLIYECSQNPTHFSVAVDKFKYRIPYEEIFGGVSAVLGDQFNDSNGFSNVYFGWGGEDDDFRQRLFEAGFSPVHYKEHSIARYAMLGHNGNTDLNEDRFSMLYKGYDRYLCDGLNSVDYTVSTTQYKEHYIFIRISLPTDLSTSIICQSCSKDYISKDADMKKTNETISELPEICNSVKNDFNV
ncbi:unnamed protein product, partial [Owenia fusiformis]